MVKRILRASSPALLVMLLWGCGSLPPVTPQAGEGRALFVEKTGTGEGVVTSDPSGIDCGPDCLANFEVGTSVILMAVAAEGSTFVGWQGRCEGSGECTLVLQDDTSIRAEFQIETEQGDPTDADDPTDPDAPTDPNDPDDPSDPSDPGDDPGDDPNDPVETPAMDETYGELLFSETAYDFEYTQYGFADSVLIEGDLVLIVAAGGHDLGQGAAYTYRNSPEGWHRSHELPVAEIMGNEGTGHGSDLSDGYAAVSYDCGLMSGDPCFGGPSGFLIFRFGSGTWREVANFRGDDEGKKGGRLAFAGDYLFASRRNGTFDVHQRDGDDWPLVQELDRVAHNSVAADDGHFFALSERGIDYYRLGTGSWEYAGSLDQDRQGGRWIDVDGDRLAYSREEDKVTALYTFESGAWVVEDEIEGFGPVALAGKHLLIGAPQNDDQAEDAGAVHVYSLSGSEWLQANTIYADDPGPNRKFGNRLDATEEFAVIGAYEFDYDRIGFQGAFYIFGHGSTQ